MRNSTTTSPSAVSTDDSTMTSTTISVSAVQLIATQPEPLGCKDEPECLSESVVPPAVYSSDKEDEESEVEVKTGAKQNKIRMPQRKGGMQLWQFLYALLQDPETRYGELMEWTSNRRDLEFRLLDPEAIAIWWGNIKHRCNMTYERLSRSLRYYYDRGILKKMGGERYLYRFCVDPEEMYQHIGNSDSRPVLKPMPVPVTKWMYSRMVSPQLNAPFFSTLAPPDYGMQHSLHQMPPPPYPGYQVDSPAMYLQPDPYTYAYLSHQFTLEPEATSYQMTQDTRDRLPSYDGASSSSTQYPLEQHTSSTITPSSMPSTSDCYAASPFSSLIDQGRSLSDSALTTRSETTAEQYQLFSSPISFTQTDAETPYHSRHTPADSGYCAPFCTSVSDSSSNSGGDYEMELDEILPILASMEDHSESPFGFQSSLESPPHYYTSGTASVPISMSTGISSPLSVSYSTSPPVQVTAHSFSYAN